MKTLIVYYSLEGNSEYAANKIAAKTGADTLRLIPKKTYSAKGFTKFLWGGKSALMSETPELEPYNVDLSAYDRIVLGFPVWAGRFTPPLRTFVTENLDELRKKDIAVFACQSGRGAENAFAKLKELIGIDAFSAEAVFIDPKAKQTPETDQIIEAFGEELAQA